MYTRMIASVGALLVVTVGFGSAIASAAGKSRPVLNDEAPLPADTVLYACDSGAPDTSSRPRRRPSNSARASLRPDSLAARLHRAKAVDTAANAPGETPPEPATDRFLLSQHEQPASGNVVRLEVEESVTPLAAKFAAAESGHEKPSRVVLASGNASQDIDTQANVVEAAKPTIPATTPKQSRWRMNLGSLLRIR